MKKITQVLVCFLIGFISYLNAQNSAPSSHMWANDNGSGDIVMKTVRSTITTSTTYYSTMGWNAGSEGGGYCGFQDSPDKGHTFIFSIWDPSNGQAITAAYTGSGTVVENFGGEGTGLKSMNSTIGWSLNEWNTVVARRWDVGSHTHFGFWVRRDSENKWHHMVTMDYPVSGVTFNGTTNAFLEDWTSTGANKRRFEWKDGFKRKTDGTWLAASQVTYNRNDESRSSNYTNAVDAGTLSGGGYFMQSGGNTTPSFSGNPPITLNSNPGSSPSNSNIVFSISDATTSSVSWSVPVSSTPQFKYTIKVNNVQVASIVDTEASSANISASVGDTVEVILEDILGRTNSQSQTVSGNSSSVISQSGWTLHYTDSNQPGEEGTKAFDGDNNTIWHTNWNSSATPPHEIQINLGASYSISELHYLPRQAGENGRIANYEIYVSTDGSNWGTAVATGTWANTASEQVVQFIAKTGSYIRLKELTEVNGNAWGSVAEINLVGAPVTCNSTTITPYLQVNGGAWQQTSNVSLSVGDDLLFGPQAASGGSWSWSGPNNYSSTVREAVVNNIQTNGAGDYIASYTNSCGTVSTHTFTINVDSPLNYCNSNGNNTSDEYIGRVQLGSIDNTTSASSGGYGDYTSISTSIGQGSSQTITITPTWTGSTYNEGYAVWIDYNKDGDFGDSGELVWSKSKSKTTPVSGTFTVPTSASTGVTRMRVSMKYNGIPSSCESFQYGEVEDYSINVTQNSSKGNTGTKVKVSESLSEKSEVLSNKFKILQNPIRDVLEIQFAEKNNIKEILLIDISGKIIFNKPIKNDSLQNLKINLSEYNLSQGIYIFKAVELNKVHTFKLLKM